MPLPHSASWPRGAHPAPGHRRYPESTSSSNPHRRAPHRAAVSPDLYSAAMANPAAHYPYAHSHGHSHTRSRPPSTFSDVEEVDIDGSVDVREATDIDEGGGDNDEDLAPGHDPRDDYDGFDSDGSDTAYGYTPCDCAGCSGFAPAPSHAASSLSSTTRREPCFALTPAFPSYNYYSHSHPERVAHDPHDSKPSPQPSTLTTLLFRFLNAYVLPHLPADLAAVIRDPPDLTRPQTLVPLLRALAPYTQYLLVLLFFYIVWAFVAGLVGYTVRFLRFCFKIGPVIALIAWIMAASGQGGIDVIFEALKQYAGLGDPNAAPVRAGAGAGAGGRARPNAGYPGGYNANANTRRRRTGGSGSGSGSGSNSGSWRKPAPPADQPDLLSAIFGNPATGDAGMGAQVQSFVKAAVARGLGLDWLMAPPAPQKEEKKRAGGRR